MHGSGVQPLSLCCFVMSVFESSFVVNAPLAQVWSFHDDPESLTKVMTGPVSMRMTRIDRPVIPGSQIHMRMRVGPIEIPWVVEVLEKRAPDMFKDAQRGDQGPFKRWVHTHRFEAAGASATRVIDRIEYTPPLGVLGRIGDALLGKLLMQGMFVGRRKATKAILER
jgi:ligand-binding SRPBCC domain-containing protein